MYEYCRDGVMFSVDCVWSEWGDWEVCSATCGTGQQSRGREEVGPFHDGAPCVGDVTDTQDCNTHNCPGKEYLSTVDSPLLSF